MSEFSPHGNNLFGETAHNKSGSPLGEKFLVPPFTVLSARDGWWQERKRAWLALGIQSELGRGGQATDSGISAPARMNDAARMQRGGADMSRVTMSKTIQRLKPSADQALKNALARAND